MPRPFLLGGLVGRHLHPPAVGTRPIGKAQVLTANG
jgi:hypothetical protein